jgi:hypothetical protein
MPKKPCVAALAGVLLLVAAACASTDRPETVLVPGAEYTAANGLSFFYPGDWFVAEDDEGPIFVATSPTAASGDLRGKGEAVVVILGPDLTAEVGASLSPGILLTRLAAEIGSESTAIGEIRGTMLNGRRAVRASLKDERGDGIGLAVDLGNNRIAAVFIGAAPGEVGQYEAIGMAIAASISGY